MTGPVLVTGATGNVGRAVVSSLRATGIQVRAASRARHAQHAAGVESVALDLHDPETFHPALDGVAGVFLLRPPAIARVGPTLNAFIDAAGDAGIEHVVFASVAGAETNRLVPHHRVERHLRASRSGWTILRPGFFAQNLGDAYRRDIRDDDRLYVPAGDGRVAFIDVRDLGDVTARVFADPTSYRGRAYRLTGPQAATFTEVAQALSTVLRRPVGYEPATIAGYVRHLRERGVAAPQIAVQALLHVGLRRGDAEIVDPTLGSVLGRRPRTVEEYIADHRAMW